MRQAVEYNRANLNDAELISKVVHGDQRAFLALYDRYSNRVYTLIFHMINDEMLAEEVLQETFLRLWSRAGQYLPERGSRSCGYWRLPAAQPWNG